MSKNLLIVNGSQPLNGKISINEATGEITIDNKNYTLRVNTDTGVWELVSADGIVTTIGAALGVQNATLLATIGFADMNAWGAVPNFVLDLASARPANSKLIGLAVVPVTPLENSMLATLSAKIVPSIITFPGAVTASGNYADARAAKQPAGIVTKADINFAGGVSANVAAGLVSLNFIGWDTLANIAAPFDGHFTAGSFKVYGLWETIAGLAAFD
jgi:hypothetical protein